MKWFEIRMVVVSVLGLCLLLAVAVPTARADFTFGEPVNLGPLINTGHGDFTPCLSADGLEVYFARHEPALGNLSSLFVARRATVDSEWGVPIKLSSLVNTREREYSPSISVDGLSLYFARGWLSGGANQRIYVTSRATKDDDWGIPVSVGAAVNNHRAFYPCISTDELELYFSSDRPGGYGGVDLWVTTRATVNDEWATPVNLGPTINSSDGLHWPAISPDGLLLFFMSASDGPNVARRATRDDPWGPPINLARVLNGTGWVAGAKVSFDGSALYFYSNRPGYGSNANIWQAPILPVVDFNGDGVVDTKDLVKLIDSWDQADPLCDIGPYPWGDGVVDAADLEVLMRYWGQQVDDPTLVGHWPFDEAEGTIAHDLVGGKDATILGLAQWQPEGGKIDGALELNGMTFGTANSPVNPASGPFSVLAWVQGGAPGQVILSQEGGMNWLMADGATGALMTEVGPPGRTGPGLISEAVITDGNWHRIAFIWDGANRWLYVDGVLVAEDARDDLPSCSGKLVFGAGKDMAPGTFFTGLIDDVRIYNRVVWP